MNLTLVSWNGDTRINDGTNFTAAILPGALINLTSQAVYVDRAENFPYLSGAVLPAHSFNFRIILPPNNTPNFISTQRELIKSIFNILDFTPHALIAKDENNKQWQLVGLPVRLTVDRGQTADVSFLITLAVMEPVWSSVTLNSDVWNVTATGQQHTVTPAGNVFARPIITVTPTSSNPLTFQFFRWISAYNNSLASLPNYPIDITNGGINTATLVNGSGVSNQINQVAGIGAGDTTIPINVPVGGGLPNVGMGFVGTEQISWTSNTGGTSLTGVTRGIGGTTAAAHANGAVITWSKIQANCADLRAQVDGAVVEQWIDAPNTAATKVWVTVSSAAGVSATLRTALPNNGTAATVQFTINNTALTFLTQLKSARNNVFIIGTEAFTYLPGNVDLVNYQITAVSRAQKFTAFAAHNIGDSAFWIEHDIWLGYGNQFVTALSQTDQLKPIIDMHNSTNSSWVYANFYDSTNPGRPGSWYGSVVYTVGKQSTIFTANHNTLANPSTELGMRIADYQLSNAWQSETAVIQWIYFHPIGYTNIQISGAKYILALGSWPVWAGLQITADWSNWTIIWNESAPTLAATWQTFSHNNALGATYKISRIVFYGTISALANNEADLQCDTITITLDSTKTPVVAVGAEQTTSYYLNARITNTTTGDYFNISINLPLNTVLTIDCNLKTVTLADGANVISSLTPSTLRADWLTLLPGANLLQYDETGTLAVTVTTKWQDRTL